MINQTQPRLLSQPHREGKHMQSAQIALRSFGANRNLESTRKNHACAPHHSPPFITCYKCYLGHSAVLSFELLHTLLHSCVGNCPSFKEGDVR